MKKLIVGLLMTAMICSLAACGGKNQSSAGTDTSAVGETAEHADSSASSEDVLLNRQEPGMVLLIQIQVLVCA